MGEIAIKQDEAHSLFISACRYCFGRNTYINSLMTSIVRDHIDELQPSTCGTIYNDIKWELRENGILDKVQESYKGIQPWVDLLPLLKERAMQSKYPCIDQEYLQEETCTKYGTI